MFDFKAEKRKRLNFVFVFLVNVTTFLSHAIAINVTIEN